MKQRKRIAALMMAATMAVSTLQANVLAEDIRTTGGLCEHHTEHTPECGYAEAASGTPCTHMHVDECYRYVTECVHVHTEECYPQTEAAENQEEPADAADEPTACSHECGTDNGCTTEEMNCTHTHGPDCGYAEETAESSCSFVCSECNAAGGGDTGTTESTEMVCTCEILCTVEAVNTECPVCAAEGADLIACTGEPAQTEAQEITITGFEELPQEVQQQTVPAKTKLADLNLPETLTAFGYTGAQDGENVENFTVEGVTWEPDVSYDEEAEQRAYVFTSVMPEGYMLAEGVKLPRIAVMVEAVNLLENQAEYDISDGAVTIDNSCGDDCKGHTITGNGQTNNAITVKGGTHNITIKDVDIKTGCAFDIKSGATVNLTLSGENILKSTSNKAGLQVTKGAALTIGCEAHVTACPGNSGCGILRASGGYEGAGIGGGSGGAGGRITISGGSIEASGGDNGAGIGGGSKGAGGDIEISGGNIQASGYGSGAGIGGGSEGAGGSITISGGSIEASGYGSGAGIGSGSKGAGGDIEISGGSIEAISGGSGAGIGGGSGGAGGDIEISGGTIEASSGGSGAGIGGGSGGAGENITISGGSIEAISGGSGAGIGGGSGGAGGSIEISGGSIEASGGQNGGAGIGGGSGGAGGSIEISGGSIEASGGQNGGAGIGGGSEGAGGTFTTNENGNAVIIADSISDQSGKNSGSWKGLIIEGDNGQVYGDVAPTADFEIPSNATITVPKESTLTINSGVTVTNNGTIVNEGTIINNGTIAGTGSKKVKIGISAGEGGTVSGVSKEGTYEDGSEITVTATPMAGYHFVKWIENDKEIGTNTEYKFNADWTKGRSIKAVFEENALIHHARKGATCTNAGNIEYWSCDSCGKKFSDANGKTEITDEKDLVIPVNASNHVGKTEVRDKKDATCTEKGYTGDTWCLDCKQKIADGTEIEAGHSYLHHQKVEPTYDREGTEEHYTCENCNLLFDSKKNETTKEKLTIPALEKPIIPTDPVKPVNGLHKGSDGKFYYYKNGVIDKKFEGIVEYDGGEFFVRKGTVAADINGLCLWEGTWYFFAQGQIQRHYTGLAFYDGEWFYLEKGVLDTKRTGIVPYDGGLFIVVEGRIAREANGLWQDPADGTWYFAALGQVQTQHTGVAAYDGAWFYIRKGLLATDYNGTLKYNGMTFKVVAGQLYRQK